MATLVNSVSGTHPARTRYIKSVKPASDNMLKPGTNNAKLGGYITAKKWQGMAMYSLTLQERTTCPTTCEQWDNCYGNNMPFAHRFDHTDPAFLSSLDAQLKKLSIKHQGEGFVVRLHVLGDFYNDVYVKWWAAMLDKYPDLNAFGYTHHDPQSHIGQLLGIMNANRSDRWVIRFSDDPVEILSAQVVQSGHLPIKGLEVICPEQEGKAASCAACGLCWSAATRKILFVEH